MKEFLHPSDIPVEGVDSSKIKPNALRPQMVVPTLFPMCQGCEEVARRWNESNQRISQSSPTMQRLTVTCGQLDAAANTAEMSIVFSYAYGVLSGEAEPGGKVLSMENTIYPGSTLKTSRSVECPALKAAAHRRKFSDR